MALSLTSSIQDEVAAERSPLLGSGSSDHEPVHPTKPPTPPTQQMSLYERRIQPCAVELFGTAVFVFVGSMTQQNELLLANAIGHGLTIALLILAFGNISGGHFNPAVSLGALIAGGVDALQTVAYWVCQLLGSIIGAAVTRGCLSYTKQVAWLPPSNGTVYEQIHGGSVTLQPGVGVGQGILVECVLTMLLVTAVIMTSIDSRTKMPTAGLAIGFAVVVDINAGGDVTEAAMNPARALGPAIMVSDTFPQVWDYHYIYWVGPLIGATTAGLLYRLLFAANDRRLILKKGV